MTTPKELAPQNSVWRKKETRSFPALPSNACVFGKVDRKWGTLPSESTTYVMFRAAGSTADKCEAMPIDVFLAIYGEVEMNDSGESE